MAHLAHLMTQGTLVEKSNPIVEEPLEGVGRNNEISPPPARVSKTRTFQFTLNNYSESELNNLKDLAQEVAQSTHAKIIELIFQEEIGEKTQTAHLQGLIRFRNGCSFKNVNKLYFNNRAHLEQCKNIVALRQYCQKSDTRAGITIASKAKPMLDILCEHWDEGNVDVVNKLTTARFLNNMMQNGIIKFTSKRACMELREALECKLTNNWLTMFISSEDIELYKKAEQYL